MGNLPADRFREGRPFLICGVDFCGPINVSLRIRGRQPLKMYVALHRKTWRSAEDVFRQWDKFRWSPERAAEASGSVRGAAVQPEDVRGGARDGVEVHPPRAPHFGGLWEAAVKSAKLLIVRQVADAALTESEVRTVLAEAIMNSRPLTPARCEPDGRSSGTTYTKRWQLLSELKRRFWQAWSKDYVHNLQGRSKWQTPEANIEVGAMVVVHNDHTPPQQWITGSPMDANYSIVRYSDQKKDLLQHVPYILLAAECDQRYAVHAILLHL
ncbi:uncharacterized protein LOC121404362 [Drosophila obscura]|uniref:uncharacterized protein LOC121404362 n=1 Tax=Drosophila obscura TaxID=7282 RepID=UPI001BB15341|nr:uncharacterized protein LOC121404362 [Drosophila obscura]